MKRGIILRLLHLQKDSRGSTIVEFATTFPILIVVTLLILDIGRAIFFYTTVNNVAAETVRYASVRGDDSPTSVTQTEVEAFAAARAVALDPANLTVTVTFTPDASAGSTVEVAVDYDMTFYLAAMMQAATLTLSGESEMEVL